MDGNFSINTNDDLDEREARGAERDPFADEWSGVSYITDSAKLNFNKLLHLSPYSEVLLVCGPLGVGKSTLLQQFVIGAKKSWKAIYIRASSLMSTEEFLRQIVHGFGLPSAGVDDTEEMLIEIGRYLQALARSGRRAIVAIDDAHLFSDEVLVIAEHILSDERSTNAISLVLTMDDTAADSRLDTFPVLLHKLAYTLRVEPYSPEEVAGYIHHRLSYSGNRPAELLFDEKSIAQICAKSGGLPGKVNELARLRLHKKGGGKRKAAGTSSGGKRALQLGMVLLGVAVVGALLLFQDQINKMVARVPAVPAPKVAQEVVVPAADDSRVVAEEKVPAEQETVVASEVDQAESAAAVPGASSGLSMGALDESVAVASDAADTPAGSEAPVSQEAVEKPQVVPEVVSAPLTVATVAAPPVAAPPPAPAPVSDPVPVPASKVAAPAKAVESPTSAKPAPQPAASVKAVAKPAIKVEKRGWLQSQDPQHFTLQLMALLDEGEVKRFVKRHKLEGQSETFSITRNGKRLTALVYGSYPDRAAADAAATSLPKAWKIKGPWVRTFESVVTDSKNN